VVQLRQENLAQSLFNLVGFQTKLTYPEQRRIFRTIPGLEKAAFARLGSMHRNTFINAPRCLLPSLQLQNESRLFFAGQITGVEGYVESAACGLLAGVFVAAYLSGREISRPPPTTALGALISHLANAEAENFQPMNINYGLFPALQGKKPRKRTDRRMALAERALQDAEAWWREVAKRRSAI
jgi:methylenetetrahydrofolate--tRNA-(uracil-5-)-methyltransferase